MNTFFDKTKPLWLPEGSIRAILALGIVALVSTLVFVQIPVPDWLVLWAGLILQSYFNHRDKVEENIVKAEDKKIDADIRVQEQKVATETRVEEQKVETETNVAAKKAEDAR